VRLFGKPNFIEITDNAISNEECDILISLFEKSDHKNGHVFADGIDKLVPEAKQCRQLSLNFKDGDVMSNIVLSCLKPLIKRYKEKYKVLDYDMAPWIYFPKYSFQKYETEDDGFKRWHTEHGPEEESSKRIMAWMFYLNNAKSGTEFMYHPTISSKKGRGVIWPAGWEYVHRGVIPNQGLKYIVTGWISFREDEV